MSDWQETFAVPNGIFTETAIARIVSRVDPRPRLDPTQKSVLPEILQKAAVRLIILRNEQNFPSPSALETDLRDLSKKLSAALQALESMARPYPPRD